MWHLCCGLRELSSSMPANVAQILLVKWKIKTKSTVLKIYVKEMPRKSVNCNLESLARSHCNDTQTAHSTQSKALAKRSQHVNATYHNIVERNMLRAFGHRVAMCCNVLGVVGSILTLVKFAPTTPNISQHVTTRWPNASNMLSQTMLRSFGRGLRIHYGNMLSDQLEGV